jgi:glycine cleavage system regulatory protein
MESAELADKCNARVSAVSEIASCESVVVGTEAVCWVGFDSAYRGDVTERITNVVSEAVTSVAAHVKKTTVSDEPSIKDLIAAIREKQKNGATVEELEKDFEALKNAIK